MKYDEIVQKLHDITFKREQEVYVVSFIENKGSFKSFNVIFIII